MPAVAIGVAVIADVVAGSAAIAGTLTAFGAIAAVGATIGAVGAVTKTPALEYIGGALGAVGGLGALATSAGILGSTAGDTAVNAFGADAAAGNVDFGAETTSAFINDTGATATGGDAISYLSDTSGVTDVGAAGTAPGDLAVDSTPPITEAGTATTDEAQAGFVSIPQGTAAGLATQTPTNSLLNSAGTGQENPAAAQAQTGVNTALNQAEGNAQASPTNPGGAPTDSSTGTTNPNPVAASTTSSATSNTPPLVTGSPAQAGNAVTGQPAPIPGSPAPNSPADSFLPGTAAANQEDTFFLNSSSSGGAFSGLLDLFNAHPALALGATQALGSFISGATSTLTPAQVNAYNAQAAANTAAAALTNRQIAAMSSPKSVATLSPVTGTPAPLLNPQAPGLINVTGLPA